MTPTPGGENCQRWNDRRHSWRHTSEGGFDKTKFEVAVIHEDTPAKAFVEQHHYSRSYPAASQRIGLYGRGQLVGVAVFGIPMQRKVLTTPFPNLEPYVESLELSRFVLLDQVPANAESWFIAQAFREIAAEGVRGVVAFADPVPRHLADGTVLSPGHVGTIYQATNGVHTLDRGTPRTLYIGPDGRVISSRSLQKIRAGEQGHLYAERQLVEWGATRRANGQPSASWLRAALDQAGVRRVRHPGNFRYLFRIGVSRAARTGVTLGLATAPYPKKEAA